MMVGHREIITQPAPHLGPLKIIESNFAEGRFVGLLPRQAPPRMQLVSEPWGAAICALVRTRPRSAVSALSALPPNPELPL
jgi:hypothetical protein